MSTNIGEEHVTTTTTTPEESSSVPKLENLKKVSIIPLIFLIFYEVSGGPFGVEDTVRAAGPLLSLVGFLVFPLIWSVPEALITAEMGTMFPENGGYVVWVSSALGPFWGFQLGWMKWLSGVIDNALYPVLFLDYLKSAIPVIGEVNNPGKTLPKALFYAVILVVLGYFLPLLVGTGAIEVNRELWSDGYFSEVGRVIGGVWLRTWVQVSSALSNMGMFVAEMSSDSFQLLGMAERGMLPAFFAKRSRYGTPLIGILFSASGVILLSWLSFQEIVAAENFLYCFGMLMEFVAFVKLRMKFPNVSRPYKIPVGKIGAVLMCLVPTLLIFVVLALATLKVFVISISAVIMGLLLQPCLKYMEKKIWLRFSVNPDLPDIYAS
ncbi:putative polyamine transporter [Trifolium pratense]|uniref:Putative polyamine transporter n=1 Tax=Trifolium pratense TaxID=57577 RepID=A0A2K3NGK2_TRIPR|nr:putative polyamine transporter [Trifolium pratense]